MIEFKRWLKTAQVMFPEKPWLVLGKGPTFSRRGEVDLAGYNLLSLNHAVRELKVSVAHIIDIDVVASCAEQLLSNCDWLLMPRRPHVGDQPAQVATLSEWIECIPVLKELDRQGRLVCYDLVQDPSAQQADDICARYFSSEAALGILGRMNVKSVRSLGVDGGRSYSASFRDLNDKTLLSNGQPSFDLQFIELEKIAARHAIDYRAVFEPMQIFVGADDSQMMAAKVLAYSIQKHASHPVRVTPMVNLEIPLPKDTKNRPRTGFSFYRLVIPQLAGYRGRALYVDSDMLVFSDVAELWDITFGKQKVLCSYQETPDAWKNNRWFHPGRQYSVMLLDCDRLDWKIEEIVAGLDEEKFTYQDLMFNLCLVQPDEIEDRIPPEWNHLEQYQPGKTKLLHYTVIDTQPWTCATNPLGHLWEEALREAVASGFISMQEIEDAIRKKYLRPELAEMVRPVESAGAGEVAPSAIAGPEPTTVAGALQKLERQLRAERQNLRVLEDYLVFAEKAVATGDERDRQRQQEIISYQQKIAELEHRVHDLYTSNTWKLGRLITKPLAAFKGGFNQ